MRLLKKQNNAVYYLKDDTTTEILYGGAAGGGKSALGCLWAIELCQRYPGIRGMIGRSKLKTLKETTLNTFFQLSSELGISDQYFYSEQKGSIRWLNGSEILLKDLFSYPSDPEFDGLGSLEISFAFIDECNQVSHKAKNVVKSRIRYKLSEFGLIPKVLMTCNPAKNWVYSEFYTPHKTGRLEKHKKFIQALPSDNPYLPSSYIDSLKQLDANSKERLLFGNWEYDDDPTVLCDYNAILSIFGLNHVEHGIRYITADVARQGSDKAVILVWDGWDIIDITECDKSKTTDIQNIINSFCRKYRVSKTNVIADEDGVGGGVVDNCQINGFLNGSKPLNEENYFNLQSQCCYKLADKINKFGINISAEIEPDTKDRIAEELSWLKSWKSDDDGRIRIIPKAEIKKHIGRSPDYRDAIMMRMWFDMAPKAYGNIGMLAGMY